MSGAAKPLNKLPGLDKILKKENTGAVVNKAEQREAAPTAVPEVTEEKPRERRRLRKRFRRGVRGDERGGRAETILSTSEKLGG